MGKKKDLTESDSDTEIDTESTDTKDTKDNKVNKKNNTIFNKINNLSRKAKLYIGICVVLLLAGLYMWYKNKKNNVQNNIESNIDNNIQPQIGGQEIIQQTLPLQTQPIQTQQTLPILSHLTPNPLED